MSIFEIELRSVVVKNSCCDDIEYGEVSLDDEVN